MESIHELRAEHRNLDKTIAKLDTNPNVNQSELRRLKKRKLMLKDKITHLESASPEHLNG